jgi:hypothetical protein
MGNRAPTDTDTRRSGFRAKDRPALDLLTRADLAIRVAQVEIEGARRDLELARRQARALLERVHRRD